MRAHVHSVGRMHFKIATLNLFYISRCFSLRVETLLEKKKNDAGQGMV